MITRGMPMNLGGATGSLAITERVEATGDYLAWMGDNSARAGRLKAPLLNGPSRLVRRMMRQFHFYRANI